MSDHALMEVIDAEEAVEPPQRSARCAALQSPAGYLVVTIWSARSDVHPGQFAPSFG